MRSSADRHSRDRGNRGDCLRGKLGGHRTLRALQAGLAEELPGPAERHQIGCDHQLIDILVIAAIAVIACAESWEDIELYGRCKQAWLKSFLALPNGIRSDAIIS